MNQYNENVSPVVGAGSLGIRVQCRLVTGQNVEENKDVVGVNPEFRQREGTRLKRQLRRLRKRCRDVGALTEFGESTHDYGDRYRKGEPVQSDWVDIGMMKLLYRCRKASGVEKNPLSLHFKTGVLINEAYRVKKRARCVWKAGSRRNKVTERERGAIEVIPGPVTELNEESDDFSDESKSCLSFDDMFNDMDFLIDEGSSDPDKKEEDITQGTIASIIDAVGSPLLQMYLRSGRIGGLASGADTPIVCSDSFESLPVPAYMKIVPKFIDSTLPNGVCAWQKKKNVATKQVPKGKKRTNEPVKKPARDPNFDFKLVPCKYAKAGKNCPSYDELGTCQYAHTEAEHRIALTKEHMAKNPGGLVIRKKKTKPERVLEPYYSETESDLDPAEYLPATDSDMESNGFQEKYAEEPNTPQPACLDDPAELAQPKPVVQACEDYAESIPQVDVEEKDRTPRKDDKRTVSKRNRAQRRSAARGAKRNVDSDSYAPSSDPGGFKNRESKRTVNDAPSEKELKTYELDLKIVPGNYHWFLNEELAFNRRHALTIGFNQGTYSVDAVLKFPVGRELENNVLTLPVVHPCNDQIKTLRNDGCGVISACGMLIGIDKDVFEEDGFIWTYTPMKFKSQHDYCMSVVRICMPDVVSRGALMSPQLLYNKCRSASRNLIGSHAGHEAYLSTLVTSRDLQHLIKDELTEARQRYIAGLENSIRMKIAQRGLSYDYEKSFCYLWESCWMIMRSVGLACSFGLARRWWQHNHDRYEQAVMERLNRKLGKHQGNFLVIPAAYALHKTNFPEDRDLSSEVEHDPRVSIMTVESELVDDEIENYGSFTYAPMVYPNGKDAKNLEAALRIRMSQPLSVDKKAMADFSRHFKNMVSTWSIDVSDREPLRDFLFRKYPKKKAEQFLMAAEEPLDESDAWSTIFVKGEAYLGKTPENYKPRMIWNRSPRIMRFGPQMSALSKGLAKYLNFHARAWYCNGAHPADVGEYAMRIAENAHILEMDVSNWDGSLCEEILELEKWFLQNKCHGWSDDIEFLFDNWTNVWGRSNNRSVTYQSKRGRRSGDYWTSSLNSLLNVAFVTWATGLDLYNDQFNLMVLGDDNVLGCNKAISADAVTLRYAQIGLKLECVQRESVEDTSFCSGLFWRVHEKLIWGNLPFRTLSKLGLNHHKHPSHIMQQLLHGTARGILGSAGHVPIFGSIARAICDSAEDLKIRARTDRRDMWEGRIRGDYTLYPTMETYVQFSERYNIPIPLILEIEELIETSLSINSFPCFLGGSLMYEGVMVDLGVDEDKLGIPDGMSPRTYAVSYAPYVEERAKLFMAQEYGLIGAADRFALTEDPNGSTLWQHRIFTLVSSINLSAGIALHSRWNSLAFDYGTVCAKGLRKKNPPKKKKSTRSSTKQKKPKSKGTWRSAVGNVLRAGGAAIGSTFGGTLGGQIGGLVGGGIAKISGMGAYTVANNSLLSANVSFGNGKISVAHREYIADIYTETSFTTQTYDINPGLATTFPWLAGLSQLYQRYNIRGLSFEYIHTGGMVTTSQNQGVIVMATQYDPDAAAFVNRREMEAYMYTTSGPIFQDQLHLVECDPKDRPLSEMYIRSGATTEERFTDIGRMTLAMEGCPTADEFVGELWVTYHVELHCPIIEPHGYSTASSAWISNGPYDSSDVLGLIQTTPTGSLDVTVGAIGGGYDTLYFPPALDSGVYLLCVSWDGASTAASISTVGFSECKRLQVWQQNTLTQASSNGTVATLDYMTVVQVTGKGAYVTFTSIVVPTSGTSVDVVFAQISDPLTGLEEVKTYEDALALRGVPVRHPVVEKERFVVDFHNEEKYEDDSLPSIDDDWKSVVSHRKHHTETQRIRRRR